MNIAAPLDELFGWVDKIQEWLNLNKLIDQALNTLLGPLFDQLGWIGQFAPSFMEVIKNKMLGPLRPIIDMIDVFLGAVNAVIDAVQEIIEWLTNPIGKLVDSIY
jgi:phage-related protein